MAKQDLVVKLMLDSGAFGQDIREAERKAKNFSDNIKGAGKTAGDLGKELGITTGALGKLGGVMTGAAGVVAAFGAFKSIMESSHTSAKTFKGTIAGFEGVLDSLQHSLATMDFTNFNNGLTTVFQNAKKAKQSLMDAQLSGVAYGLLKKEDRARLKDLEVEYRDVKTSDERRKEIKAEANSIIGSLRATADAHADNMYQYFIDAMRSHQSNISEFTSPEKAMNLLREAAVNIVFGRDKEEKKRWTTISSEMSRLDRERDVNEQTANAQILHSPPNIKIFGWDPYKSSREKWLAEAKKNKEEAEAAGSEWAKLVADNQDLMFKNVLYELGSEKLGEYMTILEGVFDELAAVEELELQVGGWSAPTKPKEEMQPVKGSIEYLKKLISDTESLRDKTEFESDAWKKLTTSLNGYKATLAEMQKIQDVYDGKVEESTVAVEGSIGYLEKLISEKEEERKALVVESDAWKDATAELKTYNAALEKLIEIRDKYDGVVANTEKKPLPGSIADVQNKISELTANRSMMVVESEAWIEATNTLKTYIAEYERLLAIQNKYDGVVSGGEDKTIKKYNDMNVAISSSITLLNGLGDAFNACEDESMKMVAGVADMMSNLASGIMSFVQIQQAAAAASGTASAAALPYPYNLAAIATVMATILSVFANIKSMTAGKFAEGGIVGGTSYSGDKLFAMVNSGEMILNKRQQSNLSNMLGGGGQVEFHISGDSLVGVLNNRQNKRHLTR